MSAAPADTLAAYLREVARARAAGTATEHTYRPFLQRLLETLDVGIIVTNEPKRAECGAPDYRITLNKGQGSLGYIEAKDIGISLDEAEKSEQLRRYRRSLPNLLLTDYLEFRWYVDGEPRGRAHLAQPLPSGKLGVDEKDFPAVLALLADFRRQTPQGISTADELAQRMARLTHLIRDLIADSFEQGRPSPTLSEWHDAFRKSLLPEIKATEFADMFAQTLAYGLFSARIMGGGAAKFDRGEAQKYIPKTNPFLRDFFYLITGPQLDDETFAPFVHDIVNTLALADVYKLLAEFGRETGRADPMLHFYETFLGAYDPALKELRGVYYTPEPVVGWLVRSVDALLRSRFGVKDGIADASRTGGPGSQHRVLVLDPAAGTATFLYAIIRFIRDQFVKRDDAGQWPGYVHRDLLPRLFGFELLMAPYACAHFKLGLELAARDMDHLWQDAWAYQFQPGERLNIFLTNTLDDAERQIQTTMGLAERALSAEALAANAVKKDLPILVVLGNPPYSGHSANTGPSAKWIRRLVRDYYQVDGKPLGERNPKWLQDDYVKFIRWSQWRLEQTGQGILAFVTNHGYLDNPTFRGMRQQLMQAFDEIWLVDLHGNSKKKETAPGGGRDQNVFDIQQGVALGVFVKLPGKPGAAKKPATVRHCHLYGPRADKYAWLGQHDVTDTKWTVLKPKSPDYFFFPQDRRLLDEYEQGWKVTDMMPVTKLGPNSHRDDFAIAFDEETAHARVEDFFNLGISDEELRKKYNLPDTRDWKLHTARRLKYDNNLIQRCIYRPFDFRFMIYGPQAFDYHRPEINGHIIKGAPALISTRQTKESFSIHVCVLPAGQHKLATPYDGSYLSPLYLFENGPLPDDDLFTHHNGARPNLSRKFVEDFSARLKMKFVPDGRGDMRKTFGPLSVLRYAYALFHAPSYRKRFAELLRVDFPRLPLTSNQKFFRELCGAGADLIDLHTREMRLDFHVSYPNKGKNEVKEVTYHPPQDKASGRVRINAEQWFENVPPEVWEYYVGGYQVCEKWLKDRKGRELSIEERQHYPRIVAALHETLRVQREIDESIAEAGGWPLK